MGPVLSDGECRTEVQSTGHVRVPTADWLDESARRAAAGSNTEVVPRSVCSYGSVPSARNREIPGASHPKKIIGKPCAGKLHARFERGLLKTGWLCSQYRVKIYLCVIAVSCASARAGRPPHSLPRPFPWFP